MTLALPAFTPPQRDAVHRLLALKVAGMMGRKFEEADWNDAYCHAKDIPCAKWSNLGIDVTHVGLGIQHKMLCVPSKVTIREFCGTQRMHPSATRSIRVPSTDGDATATARDVLGQYALLIEGWKAKVLDSAPQMVPDLRTGWLLWQDNLREFLYFEERLDAPDGELYTAEWKDSGGGTRKASRNLWVYETATGRKRFSITTSAGAKIQPYFDVPPPTDPNLYHFTVQGEAREGGLIRVWVTQSTAAALRHVAGGLDTERLSDLIIETAGGIADGVPLGILEEDTAVCEIFLTAEAYGALSSAFQGVSDEHLIQLLMRRLRN